MYKPMKRQGGGIMEAIEAAKKFGKPRAKIPLGGRVDLEQMRREVEENARQVAAVKEELSDKPVKYEPALSFLPKGTPESIRYGFEKAFRGAGPSMQVVQSGGKPAGVISEPGGFVDALQSLGALSEIPATAAGEEVFTRTGSPALAAAAYTLTDPIGAVLGAPAAGRAAIKGAKALAPKAGELAEQYMMRTGMALPMDVWHGSRMAKYGKHYEPSKKTEIFIGEKSPMWNAGAAGEAVKMEKAGVSPTEIWQKTGTFRSPDGALRQEISDIGAKFRGEKEMKELSASMKQQEADIKAKIAESKLHPDLFPKQLTAAQKEARQQAKDIRARRTMVGGPEDKPYRGYKAEFALEHPELYEAYPLLSGMDVRQGGRSGLMRASYISGINENDPGLMNIYDLGLQGNPRSSAIHEMQHAIQDIENFGRGGNTQMAFQNPEAYDILNKMRKQALEPLTYEEYSKKAGLESMPLGDAMKQYERYKKSIPDVAKKLDREFQTQAANLYYTRLAGEAEARAAQARLNMTPEQRRQKFPLDYDPEHGGYDVFPEDIIVKRKKKGGQVSLDAMRLAVGGMARGGIGKGITRSVEEARRLYEAAQKTRSKAAQEAAGLYHPIGGGVKLSKPVELMTEKTIADPGVKPVPRKIVTLEDLQGGVAIPLVGDRAAAARILKEVEGKRLREPVKLQGGPGFMQAHTFEESPESSAAWASGPGVITRLGGLARKASELAGTEKVYAPYVAMSQTGVDFNTMVVDALIGQYDPASLTKKAKKEFLKDVRNYVPDTKNPHIKPGSVLTEADLNDVESLREKMLAPDAGPLRKVFVERMGIREFQEKGFPDVAATRKAITEPELLHEEVGSTGFNIARIDPEGRIVEEPRIPHATYPVQLRGQYFGSLEEPIPFSEFFSGFTESQRLKGKPEKHDWYTFGRSMPLQQLDQEWLDQIMKARQKPREWKKGGAVKKAAGGMTSIPQKIMRAFVEAGKKAKLPEKAKEAIAKGETYIPDEETRRLQREILQGVKKPEELAEGGQITSDDLILEERPL